MTFKKRFKRAIHKDSESHAKRGKKGGWRRAMRIARDHENVTRDSILDREGWDAQRLDRSGASEVTRRLIAPCDVVARHRKNTLFIECKKSTRPGAVSMSLKFKDLDDVGNLYEAKAPWGKGVKILVFAGTARRGGGVGLRNYAAVPLDFLLDLIEDRYGCR